MAATAVLRSQDCLPKPHRIPFDTHRRNPQLNPNSTSRSRRRRRSPPAPESKGRIQQSTRRITDRSLSASPPTSKGLVMGQVTILKRGEPLPENKTVEEKPDAGDVNKKVGSGGNDEIIDLTLFSTGRFGPEPEVVRKEILASDFYAGSAPIVASPHPSALPFPGILAAKKEKIDEKTSNLLRLLRLDLS